MFRSETLPKICHHIKQVIPKKLLINYIIIIIIIL